MARGLLLISYPHDFAVLSVPDVLRAWRDGLRFDATVVARLFGLPLLLMNLPGRWFARRLWIDSLAWFCYALLSALALFLAAIGLITREGWLVHNLLRRLAAIAFDAAPAPDFERMERKLLALDQASYELLRENRWAP